MMRSIPKQLAITLLAGLACVGAGFTEPGWNESGIQKLLAVYEPAFDKEDAPNARAGLLFPTLSAAKHSNRRKP
jgi:hypothetical protein